MFSTEQARTLLQLARHAIESEWTSTTADIPVTPWLHEPAATFVTLWQDGELRGCVGSLEARRSLREDIYINAHAAAFGDPRFAPLERSELSRTDIELSLLSPAQPFSASSESDALAQLRPSIDGVVLEFGPRRSTFLPQVWEQLPQAVQFLAHLKLKAGLPADFWSNAIKLSRYTVDKFIEKDLPNDTHIQNRGEATRVPL